MFVPDLPISIEEDDSRMEVSPSKSGKGMNGDVQKIFLGRKRRWGFFL